MTEFAPEEFELPKPVDPLNNPPIRVQPIPAYDASLLWEADIHVNGIKETNFTSFREFMWRLIFCQNFNDLQKSRAIFRYLTLYKLENISFLTVPQNSPEEIFDTYKSGELASFSRIYQLIACYAGLPCSTIYGHAKGVDHLPGMSLLNEPANHSWNAVFVDGAWRLIDSHWGSRYISTIDQNRQKTLIHEFDDYYFFMPPNRAIYSHLPLDAKWQLISPAQQMSLEIFELLPLIKNQYFSTTMRQINAPFGILHSVNGLLQIKFSYEACSEFVCRLDRFVNDQLTETYQGYCLRNFVLLETREKLVILYFRLPFEGDYYFTLFNKIILSNKELGTNMFRAVCMYKIICDTPYEEVTPYIGFSDTNFGLCWPLLKYYYMEPMDHREGVIHILASELPYVFQCSFRLQWPKHVRLMAKLFTPSNEATTYTPEGKPIYLEEKVDIYLAEDVATFTVNILQEGEQVLEIFANKATDGETYTNICQYLLDCKKEEEHFLSNFPSSNDNYNDLLRYLPDPYSKILYSDVTWKTLKDLQSLVNYLLKDCVNPEIELTKIRAIFSWLTSVNLDDLSLLDAKEGSPVYVMMQVKTNEVSYAEVFQMLCELANIECQVVHGYAKGCGFTPTIDLAKTTRALHSWNAANVDGSWKLFDCNWAARHLLNNEDFRAYYEPNDFYFMVEPSHFQCTHYPHEKHWQLVQDPIKLEEFNASPAVKHLFFCYGMSLLSHKQGVIKCTQPYTTVLIQFPVKHLRQLFFTYTFKMIIEEKDKTTSHKCYESYGITQLKSYDPPIQAFTFRFPSPGQYHTVLFVRHFTDTYFSSFCEYTFQVTSNPNRQTKCSPLEFPSDETNYGATDIAKKLGITCDTESAVLCNIKDFVEIFFEMESLNESMLSMTSRLKKIGSSDDDLSHGVMMRKVRQELDDNGFVEKFILRVFPPMEGEYALQVYAKPRNSDEKETCYMAYQFLLHTATPFKSCSLPLDLNETFGATDEFYQLGLSIDMPADPFIQYPSGNICNSGDSDVRVSVHLPQNKEMFVTCNFTFYEPNQPPESVDNYVLQQIDQRSALFLLRLPKVGFYKLHIYAGCIENETIPIDVPLVYTCAVYAEKSFQPGPYPQQSIKWKESGYLNSPLDGKLRSNQSITQPRFKFSLVTTGAHTMAVVINNHLYHLEGLPQKNPDQILWEGNVSLPDKVTGTINVMGKWGSVKEKFVDLLEYEVAS